MIKKLISILLVFAILFVFSAATPIKKVATKNSVEVVAETYEEYFMSNYQWTLEEPHNK